MLRKLTLRLSCVRADAEKADASCVRTDVEKADGETVCSLIALA